RAFLSCRNSPRSCVKTRARYVASCIFLSHAGPSRTLKMDTFSLVVRSFLDLRHLRLLVQEVSEGYALLSCPDMEEPFERAFRKLKDHSPSAGNKFYASSPW